MALGGPRGDFQDFGPKVSNSCGRGRQKSKKHHARVPAMVKSDNRLSENSVLGTRGRRDGRDGNGVKNGGSDPTSHARRGARMTVVTQTPSNEKSGFQEANQSLGLRKTKKLREVKKRGGNGG